MNNLLNWGLKSVALLFQKEEMKKAFKIIGLILFIFGTIMIEWRPDSWELLNNHPILTLLLFAIRELSFVIWIILLLTLLGKLPVEGIFK